MASISEEYFVKLFSSSKEATKMALVLSFLGVIERHSSGYFSEYFQGTLSLSLHL